MIFNKQIGYKEAIADLATGGAVTLVSAAKIEQVSDIVISQTTAGQAITLPAPASTVPMSVSVMNAGTAAFTIYGVTLNAGTAATFYWNGAAWASDAAPTNLGGTVETLVATGANALPNLASKPLAGGLIKWYVNGVYVPAGISVDAAGVVTVTAATVGFDIDADDVVVVEYFA